MKITNWLVCALWIGTVLNLSSDAIAETVSLKLNVLEERSQMGDPRENEKFLYHMTYPQYRMIDQDQSNSDEIPAFSKMAKKEPTSYQCEHPFRGVFELGDHYYPFVLDGENLDSQGYDTFYFDANRNGDLTDDTVVQANDMPQGVRYGRGSANREFPKQTIAIEADGEKYDYSFFLRVYSNTEMNRGPNQSIYAYASINAAAYREGEITLNGKKSHIVVMDFNSNGHFDDEPTVEEEITKQIGRFYAQPTDMVLLNPNLQNKDNFGYGFSGREERHPVSKLICIDDAYYQLKVSATGDELTLTPSKVKLGNVKNPNENYSAVVFGDHGFIKIDGAASKPVALPEGKWKLLEYKIDLTDPNDRFGGSQNQSPYEKPYTLISAYGTPECPEVVVSNGETVAFPFGPPYHPQVEMRKMGSRRTEQIRLEMKLIGSTGELCDNLLVKGERPEDPSFVIATPSGEIVERAKFEYG